MPGPKMGPRPPDFNEGVIKASPTYAKWAALADGQTIKYACREFIKGRGNDEERLMRRIMIARRNNIKDHEVLKKARAQQFVAPSVPREMNTAAEQEQAKPVRVRRPASTFADSVIEREMDVGAVEKTRSYRTWSKLKDGQEFTYNQKYVKGRDGHDWLLRKNIWRRMRYRRENKKMVEQLKTGGDPSATHHMIKAPEFHHHHTAAHHLASTGHSDADVAAHAAAVAASKSTDFNLADQAAVEAAVAAAESFGKLDKASNGVDVDVDDDDVDMKVAAVSVQNPLGSAAAQAALDAAAQLAAAAGVDNDDMEDLKEVKEEEEHIGATAV